MESAEVGKDAAILKAERDRLLDAVAKMRKKIEKKDGLLEEAKKVTEEKVRVEAERNHLLTEKASEQ